METHPEWIMFLKQRPFTSEQRVCEMELEDYKYFHSFLKKWLFWFKNPLYLSIILKSSVVDFFPYTLNLKNNFGGKTLIQSQTQKT